MVRMTGYVGSGGHAWDYKVNREGAEALSRTTRKQKVGVRAVTRRTDIFIMRGYITKNFVCISSFPIQAACHTISLMILKKNVILKFIVICFLSCSTPAFPLTSICI